MVEILSSHTEQLEEQDIFSNTQKELNTLKESILSADTQNKKEAFGIYLQNAGIDTKKFPRESGLGKFLRTFRYYKEIKNISTQKGIPTSYFFGLKMIEGEGDPSNINTLDGGTGISQIQPDTFKWFCTQHLKKNYKVFYDNPKYAYYNYEDRMNDPILKKKYPKDLDRRPVVNKLIANKLVAIRKECNYDMQKLMALDDRFNPQIALEFSAEYLLYCKKQVQTETLIDKSRDKYKNDAGFNFEWMLAFNGYNKGPKRYDKKFEDNHIPNLKKRIEQYELYSHIIDLLIVQGYSNKDILDNLAKYAQKVDTNVVRKWDRKPPEGLVHDGVSKDGKYTIYQYTVKTKNIYDIVALKEFFTGKSVLFTDGAGKEINLTTTPLSSGAVIYIKQPI